MPHGGGVMQLEIRIEMKCHRSVQGAPRVIFQNFALSVPAGWTGALLGPSGCGKTTLLRMVSGLDRDFKGDVTLPGKGRIAYAFQEPRLLAWRNVEQNIRFVAPRLSDRDLAGLLERFELDGHAKHFPGELSLGLARRVSLARAMAAPADVVLLDEPFASLDDGMRGRIRGEIARQVQATGATVLLVTHDIEDAHAICGRVFTLAGAPVSLRSVVDLPTGAGTRSLEFRAAAARAAPLTALASPQRT